MRPTEKNSDGFFGPLDGPTPMDDLMNKQESFSGAALCLNNSQDPLRRFIENTSDVMVGIDPDANIVVFNPAATDYYGWPAQEVLGKNLITLCLCNGCPLSLTADIVTALSPTTQMVYQALQAYQLPQDASMQWESLSCELPHMGSVLFLQGCASKHSQETGVALLKMLPLLSAGITGSFYWKDWNGRYLGCNDFLVDAIQCAKSDIMGRTDFDLFGEQAVYVRQHDLQVMKHNSTMCFKEPLTLPGRSKHQFTVLKMPLRDSTGNVVGVIGHAMDITSEIVLERALKKSRQSEKTASCVKSEFIACMSHDFRTPLNGIMGMVEALQQEGTLSEHQENCVQDIMIASEQLSTVIDTVLLLSKLEEADFALEKETFNLEKTLEKDLQYFQRIAKQKQLGFSTHIDSYLSKGCLMGDKKKLFLILQHLLSNAFKFTEEGEVSFRITCLNKVDNNVTVQVIISDTGIGISQEQLPNIFEQFNRTHASYKGQYEGLGLGLTIVKRLVDKMKGDIRVVSDVERGTSFVLTLTLPWQANPGATGKTLPAELAAANAGDINYKVLLVEDNPINQRVVINMLKPMHCDVDVAGDGKTALELFHTQYDFVLMDIGLPDMSGYTLTKEIKTKLDPEGKVPIFALTAHVSESDTQHVLEAGMKAHLKKPIKSEALKQVIYDVKKVAAS